MIEAALDIQIPKAGPLENLFIDEALVALGDGVLAVRPWVDPPALVLGRFQDPALEVNRAAHRADPVPIVKRFSGGGTVFHDPGVLNLSLSIPTQMFSNLMPSPETLSQRIRTLSGILASALPVVGPLTMVDDHGSAVVQDRKILGCAAFVRPGRLLYHASILVNADLDRLHRLIRWDESSVPATAVASRRRPVVNLSAFWRGDMSVLIQRLRTAVQSAFGVDAWDSVTDETGLSRHLQSAFHTLHFHSQGVDHV